MREVVSLIPYVVRSIVRARVRTTTTLVGAALAMGLYSFVRVMDEGVAALASANAESQLVVFQESRFCPMTSELPMRYEGTIADVDGVREVLPTLLFVNSCRANLDLVTLHGVPDGDLRELHELRLVAGPQEVLTTRAGGALIGRRLADRRGAEVGERIRLGEVDVAVGGVFESDDPGLDNVAFVTIDQLALARDRAGTSTQFFVTLEDGVDAAAVGAAIDGRFQSDAVPTRTRTRRAFVSGAVAEIAEVLRFSRALGYLAVAVVVLILANNMLISIGARMQELAVLRAIGLPGAEGGALITLEGALLGLAGGVLGAAAVMTVLWWYPVTLGVEGHGIDFRANVAVLAETAVVAMGVGALAAIPSAVSRARGGFVGALRAE